MTMTMPSRIGSSAGKVTLSGRCHPVEGNKALKFCAVAVKRNTMIDWMTMSSPMEATTLASAGAWRSGMKMHTWMSNPTTAERNKVMSRAGHRPQCPPTEAKTGQCGRRSEWSPRSCAIPSIGAKGLGRGMMMKLRRRCAGR